MSGEFFDAGASSAGTSPSPTPAAVPAPALVAAPAIEVALAPDMPDTTPELPAHIIGPSLRQDMPRPPLRALALVTLWRLRDLASRARAGVARIAAFIVACLDAYIWQPALWPFRPAQRELLARTLAVLSVTLFAAGWVAAYNALTPADAPRPAATLPAPPPPKPLTERIVSHPLPKAKVPAKVSVEALKAVAPAVAAAEAHAAAPPPVPHKRKARHTRHRRARAK